MRLSSPYRKVTKWLSLTLYGLLLCGGIMAEVWRAVVGWEGWYEVSSLGRVRNIIKRGGTWVGRILKPRIDKRWGYHSVVLCRNGMEKTFKIHRLVLMAFVRMPQEGEEGNHKFGNKGDNSFEKLEWVTKSENWRHSYLVLGRKKGGARGEKNGVSKLTCEQVYKIKQFILDGKLTHPEIAGKFNISRRTIGDIKSGKTWNYVQLMGA